MRLIRQLLSSVVLFLSAMLLFPLTAPAITTPIFVVPTFAQAVFIYDAGMMSVVSNNAFTGSEAVVTPAPFFDSVAGLDAAESATPLFRAVNQAELGDLSANAGAFRNPLGIEVKYFSQTAEGAASYARQTYQAGGSLYQGPYTIVRTDIPSDLITPIMRALPDRGIPTVVVPTELLPRLTPAHPLPFTPLPGRP